MKKLWTDRRLFCAIFAIGCLTALGVVAKIEVAGAISAVAMTISVANAWQSKGKVE